MTEKLRAAAELALEQVQEFKRRWWLVPAFGNKVNKATREAVTNAHSPIFALEHDLRAALAEREACADVADYLPVPESCAGMERSLWDVACPQCAAAIRARGAEPQQEGETQ